MKKTVDSVYSSRVCCGDFPYMVGLRDSHTIFITLVCRHSNARAVLN